ncbi:MAG: BTAD domain-containing putative transcriptional regulator [Caldilineaceae bacterium]
MFVPNKSALETGMMSTLSIHTFGTVTIALQRASLADAPTATPDARPVKVETRTIEALLIYVACQGRPMSRDLLAELLWPERTQDQARANLRLALHRLRRQLDPFLLITRQSIGLNPSAVIDVDAMRFETHLADGQLAQATALYQGDFLAGFYLDESPAYEQWALLERERLRTLALAAWQQRVEQLAATGQRQAAIEGAQRLLQLDPLHEATHRHLIRLLAQTGQRSAALAQYESCRQLLLAELDAPPDEITTALAEQIRSGELDRRTRGQDDKMNSSGHPVILSSLHNLPPQSTGLIGRATELAQIAQLLANPDCRLLTLLGGGGIGKTRLAIETARRILELRFGILASDTAQMAAADNLKSKIQNPKFEDGIYFVGLAGLEERNLLTVALAQSLRLQNSGGDLLTQVAAYLQPRELLLILDNFEQITEGAETLAYLLHRAPRLKLIVTSRQRLALLEEWLLPVGGLSSKRGWADEAGQLFVRSAQRVQPGFAVQGQEEAIAAICRQVEGMPLALELAASWVRVMPCTAIAHQIASSLDFLASGLRNTPERHRSLRALFDHSWRLLSSAEQQVLQRVSLFRGGWLLDEAVAIAEATLPLLAALVDKSLVRADAQGRFEMHELLRQYAVERLDDSGEGERIRRRHFVTYLQLARTADAQLRGAAAATWYRRLDAELDNLRAAWEWALARKQVVDAAWLGVALSHFWGVRLQFHEATFWLEQLLPHRQSLPPDLRLATLLTLYHVWRGNDNFASIDGYMAELRELQAASTNPCLQAVAWRCMGVATADFAQAMRCWERCIGLLRAAGDTASMEPTYSAYSDSGYQLAFALFRNAIRLIDVGDYRAAERLSAESLALFRRRDNRDYIVAPLGNLGRLALLRGDLPQARLLLQEAVAIARGTGNVLGLIDCLPRLAVVTLYSGDAPEAQRLLEESLHLSRTISSPMYLAWNFTYLAETALWQGDLDQAARWLAQAVVHHANPRWVRTELVDCLWIAARLATAQQHYQRAATLFGLAEQVGSRIGYLPAGPVRPLNDTAQSTVQAALEPTVFAEAFAAGQGMTLAEAFATLLAQDQGLGKLVSV